LLFAVSLAAVFRVGAQTAPVVGLRDNTPSVYAITNARIVVSPGNVIEAGSMVIRNGIITETGQGISIPSDAWIKDMEGKTIYPGFIDLWAEIGISDPGEAARRELSSMNLPPEYAGLAAQLLMQRPGADIRHGALHHNPQVRSWFDVASGYSQDDEKVRKLRSNGFVLANAVSPSGIFRGKSALVSLGEGDNNNLVVKPAIAQAIGFERSASLGGGYPTSLMGVISLIRQTLYDAEWYSNAHTIYELDPSGLERPEMNLALESLLDAVAGQKPVIFNTTDEIALKRAVNISEEFGLDLWVKGSGYEYRRLDLVAEAKVPLILPLNFPDVPDLESPEKAMSVSLEDLRHWDFAPENPGRLQGAGVKLSLTASGSDDKKEFIDRLRIAVERGLEEDEALRALTVTPAGLLGIENRFGTLEKGKVASFIVADGSVFSPGSKIEEVWIDGEPFEISKAPENDIRGKWDIISADLGEMELDIKGETSRLKGVLEKGDKSVDLQSLKFDNHRAILVFNGDSIGIDGIVRLSASVSGSEMFGIGELSDGGFINWKAVRSSGFDNMADTVSRKPTRMSEGKMLYPSMEYGFEAIPDMPENVIVKNATIWTQGPEGKLENADLLVSRGRIVQVGEGIDIPGDAVIVDGTGKHVTPGLVDPHLHSSIKGGVNEVGNNMTPETRIADVIEPDNIWVYRLLAGGMTTANLLHGSANPVGGQDAVIKMRWGAVPDDMFLDGATPGLKLALGENVVRNSNQYPNTRMGAEQIIRDAFQAAKEYIEDWEKWERNKTGIPPRKDLQLEAMAEVLHGERIIHAHAYRQDEMQMLMRLAGEMGFHIASFEHTVEGYKIADILREHGAAAIVWTDWSSFKVEAADGILYNAKMLIDQGVLTSLHSDNTQLSTRMNWEAGKMLATGIDEVTAMDLITINPARIIGADKHVGSLEAGKSADFVIWNGHPLSGFTRAEQTWVDGRKYFDREEDLARREKVRRERAALIRKAMESKKD